MAQSLVVHRHPNQNILFRHHDKRRRPLRRRMVDETCPQIRVKNFIIFAGKSGLVLLGKYQVQGEF